MDIKKEEVQLLHNEFDQYYQELLKINKRLFEEPENKYNWLFSGLNSVNKKLCLAYARCKCEKCGSTVDLTIHHMYTRRDKYYMPFNKYLSLRYYWKNTLILCTICHKEFHSNEKEWEEDLHPINKGFIEKIKEKYLE